MQESADRLRLSQLLEQHKHVSKAPFVPDIDRIGWTFQAYQSNAAHLLTHIQMPDADPAYAIETRAPGDHPEIYRQFTAELYRLILNYVASTSTLIEHTYVVERKLEITNADTQRELIRRKDPIVRSGVSHFVKNLRNFILHRDLPSHGGAWSWHQDDNRMRYDTTLSVERLQRWKKWDREAVTFMREKAVISLSSVIVEYDRMILELYDWIFKDVLQVASENAKLRMDLDIAITYLEHKLGLPSSLNDDIM